MKNINNCSICMLLIFFMISCEQLVEVPSPRTQMTREAVFESDLTATAAISQIYADLALGLGSGGFSSWTYLSALSSDELVQNTGNLEYIQFSQNSLLSTNQIISSIWQQAFHGIYLTNATIEGLEASTNITPSLKDQLISEAKFIRAFHHFYLTGLFGEIPYITSTDYRINNNVTRVSTHEIYAKIIDDLTEAKTLLEDDYAVNANQQVERIRVNKWVAASLLARVYLYLEDWAHAEEQSTAIIENGTLYNLEDSLDHVFLKNSKEAIWQLPPLLGKAYIAEGEIFTRGYDPDIPELTESFLNAFEIGDKRRIKWVFSGLQNDHTWHHPAKYKEGAAAATGAEYYCVFRLSEQFLIRAEARAQQNKFMAPNDAGSDLNKIRIRAGLPAKADLSKYDWLKAIEQERRIELFVEWGHRWLDLKRTNQADVTLLPVKPLWTSTDALYPIPNSELLLNPNIAQNPGY